MVRTLTGDDDSMLERGEDKAWNQYISYARAANEGIKSLTPLIRGIDGARQGRPWSGDGQKLSHGQKLQPHLASPSRMRLLRICAVPQSTLSHAARESLHWCHATSRFATSNLALRWPHEMMSQVPTGAERRNVVASPVACLSYLVRFSKGTDRCSPQLPIPGRR